MKHTALRGHALRTEGYAVEEISMRKSSPRRTLLIDGKWYGLTDRRIGKALCECGEWSPKLPSTAARQRWHRDHKACIRGAS